MHRLPQCFRCGQFGHVQLGCPNLADPEAKLLCNQLSRAQRTMAQHTDYLGRYNSRRQAYQNYNGTVASLQPMVNREIDYVLEIKLRMEEVPSTDLGLLLKSSVQVRALKEDMHSKLAGFRDLIYTCKNTRDPDDPDFENKHQVEIFRRQTQDLDDLRNAVWRDLWKLDRHMDFGVKLLGEIRGMKEDLQDYRSQYLDRKGLLDNGVTRKSYEEMRKLEQDAQAALDKLYLFCPDQRVRQEQKFLRDVQEAIAELTTAVIYFASDADFTTEDLEQSFIKLEDVEPPVGSIF